MAAMTVVVVPAFLADATAALAVDRCESVAETCLQIRMVGIDAGIADEDLDALALARRPGIGRLDLGDARGDRLRLRRRRVLALEEDDPAAGGEMGQRGREMILTRFTWPKIAERSIELYEKYR